MLNSIFLTFEVRLKLFEFHSKFKFGRCNVTALHGFHKVQLYLGNLDAMNCCMGLA